MDQDAEKLALWFVGNNQLEQDVIIGLKKLYAERIEKKIQTYGRTTALVRHQRRNEVLLAENNYISTMQCGDVNALLVRFNTITQIPETMVALLDVIQKNYNSAKAIVEIITSDPVLATKVIQFVNSSLYGYPRCIDSVTSAVGIIGRRQLRLIALSVIFIELFRSNQSDIIGFNPFWRHSIGCGILCMNIGKEVGYTDGERLYLAGLLHDIGRLFMMTETPGMMRDAIHLSGMENCPLYEAELSVFGFDHCQAGAQMMQTWNCPQFLIDSIGGHHAPDCPNIESCIIYVADTIAHTTLDGESGVLCLPKVSLDNWKKLNLGPSDITRLVAVAAQQYQELTEILI